MSSTSFTTSLTRRVFQGAGAVAVGNVVIRLLSLVTMPILTRLLPPNAYGTAALVGTTISFANVLGVAGLDMSYAKAFHANDGLRGVDAEREVWRIALRLSISVAFGASLLWIFLAPRFWGERAALAGWVFAGTAASSLATLAQASVRLRSQYGRLAIVLAISGVIAACSSLFLALAGWRDERPLMVAMLISYGLPLLVLGSPGLQLGFRPSAADRASLWAVIKVGLAGLVTAPLYWLLSSSDRWFLAALRNTAEVGIYSLGYSVANLGVVVNIAVGAVWLPECARLYGQGQDSALASTGELAAKVGIALLITWVAVSAAGGDAIRLMAGPAFRSAASVVPWIALAVLANGWLQVGNAGLILTKRLPQVIVPWMAGGLVSVGLNLALVPRFGAMGAAFTQALVFASIAVGTWVLAQRALPTAMPWKRLLLAGFVALPAGFLMAPAWSSTPALSLALKFPIGLGVALLMAWLAAPGFTARVLRWRWT